MDCRAVGRLLQSFLDGAVEDTRAVAVANHLDECRECGLNAESYRWLKAAVAAAARADDPGQVQRVRAFAEELISGQGR